MLYPLRCRAIDPKNPCAMRLARLSTATTLERAMVSLQYKGRIHKSKFTMRSLRYILSDQAARLFPALQQRWLLPVESRPIAEAACGDCPLPSARVDRSAARPLCHPRHLRPRPAPTHRPRLLPGRRADHGLGRGDDQGWPLAHGSPAAQLGGGASRPSPPGADAAERPPLFQPDGGNSGQGAHLPLAVQCGGSAFGLLGKRAVRYRPGIARQCSRK